jgi:hypothetical protein
LRLRAQANVFVFRPFLPDLGKPSPLRLVNKVT